MFLNCDFLLPGIYQGNEKFLFVIYKLCCSAHKTLMLKSNLHFTVFPDSHGFILFNLNDLFGSQEALFTINEHLPC